MFDRIRVGGWIVGIAAVAAWRAFAYLPPVEEKDGIVLSIGSFPQEIAPFEKGKDPYARPLGVTEVAAGAARTFPVTVSNRTERTVAGRLKVWMNDDWTVSGPQGELALGPGEGQTLLFSGAASARALDALYPVHATFTPDGAAPNAEVPHPIAIFRYVNPSAPRIVPAPRPPPESTPADWAARETAAGALARRALAAGTDAAAGRYRLEDADGIGAYGAGVVRGPRGLEDGVIAFTDGARTLSFRGFTAAVETADGASAPRASAEVFAERGALRVRWSLPGVTPDPQGFPRFADLAIGAASERPLRVYAGFGNVIAGPKRFEMSANGFNLSTRHVAADYEGGLSVLQAVDVPPDSVVSDGDRNVYALHAHLNATFSFVPSAKGSFAAGRRFRAVSGYRSSPGRGKLGARMCLDQWGGDYAKAASDLRTAARYGLSDAIFVKHDWQRWGYDYRLPEIYPPRGDAAAFGEMRAACAETGILFCPHDNYTDIYPDCEGFTYDLVVFNLDGTPQKAWFNSWRTAQSYRWAPHAFRPWCLRNAKLLKEGFDPDAVFIDVLTAHGPFDYLDREGRFHSKSETSGHWGEGFGAYREGLRRPDTVCVSEAGQDHLVGVLDAGQSDHFGAGKIVGASNFEDSERTPWHDIVTHNYFVLFAGGLGGRYQEEAGWHTGGDPEKHGYASDDYLSNAILGGRNPMCAGPFSRKAVKTYWLHHDICAELGASEFLDLAYDGGDIHRQHAVFSNGGEVWANRRTNEVWRLPNGVVLPPYGHWAKTATCECGVVMKDGGETCGYAKGKSVDFYEARGKIIRFPGVKTDGSFRLIRTRGAWRLVPLRESKPFSVEIDLAAFGSAGVRVMSVETEGPGESGEAIAWSQAGDVVKIRCAARTFAYLLRF